MPREQKVDMLSLKQCTCNAYCLFQKPAKNCCEWMRNFFDMRYVKETMMVAFKKGPNNRRLRVIMLVVVLCVVIGPIYGKNYLHIDLMLPLLIVYGHLNELLARSSQVYLPPVLVFHYV